MKITIRKKIFEQEFFKEQLAKSTSFTSLAKALNFNFCNGVLNKDLKDAVKRLGLNTDHFSLGGNTRKYPLVKKNCPVCNNEFVVAKGSQKEETTCSRSCSNTYFHELRYSEEINTKRGKSTKEAISNLIKVVKVQNISDEKPKKIKNTKDYIKYERECLFCKNIFIVNKSDGRIYCSVKKR